MKKLLLIPVSALLLFASCKKCDCNENWDPNITYKKNSYVLHDGYCWKSDGQGKGIEPGPWLQNGNDIWHECKD